jgi:hypothetical protein
MIRLILTVLMVHLSGCLAIPVPHEKPYKEKEADIARIHTGETSRQEILAVFGHPDLHRDNSMVWIYGDSVIDGHITMSMASFYSWDYQLLVAEFEQDTVKSFELVEDKLGCSASGICLPYGWDGEPPMLRQDHAIVASKRQDDLQAKKFQGNPEKCSLYAFLNRKHRRGNVRIDSNQTAGLEKNTYLHLSLDPGSHRMKAGIFEKRGEYRWDERSVSCDSGDVLFIEIIEGPKNLGRKPKMEAVEQRAGRKAIKSRYLVLLP